MLRELISIFRDDDPLADIGQSFTTMLKRTQEMNFAAGRIFFGEVAGKGERERIYEGDTEVNELERRIRRAVMTHLSVSGNRPDVPYSLLLISLIKDVERLGDYAKNLSEIVDIQPDPLPEGSVRDSLMAIRRRVELAYQSCSDVFTGSRKDEATELIRQGRETARQCDQLILEIGRGNHDAATTTALILGTRYYKRIGGHLLNVLSSVVMPLDQVDYYDEDAFPSVPDA